MVSHSPEGVTVASLPENISLANGKTHACRNWRYHYFHAFAEKLTKLRDEDNAFAHAEMHTSLLLDGRV